MSDSVNIRMLALETLLEIEKEGKLSHLVIRSVLEKYQYLPKQERAFYTRLTEGCLEYRIYLDYVIDLVSKVKTPKMKPVLREILRLSVYQILMMNSVPNAAAVNEGVKLAGKKGFGRLKGYVNGVLRSVIRLGDKIQLPEKEDLTSYLSVRYSMPEELVERWLHELGAEKTEHMLRYFLEEKKTYIRIRKTDNSLEESLESLKEAQVKVKPVDYASGAYMLLGMNYLYALKAFREGKILVQDASSMLAVEAAGIKQGDTVLDLCAAPGGKSIYAADSMEGSGLVLARDLTEYKTDLIWENASRCHLSNIKIETQDATQFTPEWEGKADVVLADVPCSGFGVIGRKPDIKYRASGEKQEELIQIQREILTQAVRYVKTGGTLMFSTCTIGAAENQDTVAWLLQTMPLELCDMTDCVPAYWKDNPDIKKGYLQIIPGEHPMDGFFFAKFKKTGEM